MSDRPLTSLQEQVLAVIADAKAGEISGLSIVHLASSEEQQGGSQNCSHAASFSVGLSQNGV